MNLYIKLHTKIIALLAAGLLSCQLSDAQLIITDEPNATVLAQQLVGPGVSISNVSFTGNSLMAGHFKNLGGLTSINLDSGIVLTSGSAKTNNTTFVTGCDGDGIFEAQSLLASIDRLQPGDPDLANTIGLSIDSLFDACVLEFDFIPSGDSVKFNYVFSSEEYTLAYVCSYNDAFAFFISGPGITGQRNIALVPGTNIPVSIFNVNEVEFGTCPNNTAYFHDNILNKYFTHDGHTVVLSASSAVQPCNTYHLKLVIADAVDGILDSGVFLEGKSLTSNEPPALQSVSAANSCGGNQLAVNFSENIICSSIQSTDFAITGPGGPYTVSSWTSSSCAAGNSGTPDINLTVSPAIAANGNFQVCLTNVSGSVTDFCGNVAQPTCLNFNVATTIPGFNPISPICSGSTAPVLPNTSTNGITGTWNPPIINNTISGTYLFTPSVGQCAVTTTLAVSVNSVLTSNSDVSICSNQLPYNWNGNNYTTAGTYSVTLISSSGCDSVATLNLSTNTGTGSTTTITICEDQLPFNWNGNNYPVGGTYSVSLMDSDGCDSVATLILLTNPLLSSTTFASICENQFPYSWNGNSYPSGGTYSVILTGNNGCDSVAVLNLAVNGISTSTSFATICENLFPYTWNGNSYPSAGTYSITLVGSSGCDSIATLNLAANAVVSSTTSITICENQLPYNWNGNNYPLAGTYSTTLINSNGCDSIATLELSVNDNTASITAITICENELPYNWNGNNYPAAGSYSTILTNGNGCDSVATFVLVVNNNTTSTTAITICENELPYNWNGNSYPAAGSYSTTLINSNGCDSVTILVLMVNNNTASTTAITICENQLPYNWNGNNYPAAGSYSTILTNGNGCDSITTLQLTVNNNAASTTSITICENQLPYTWNGNNYPVAGTYTINLTNNDGCDSVTTLTLSTSNVVSSTTMVSICPDQLPYNWNGNNYSAEGNYTVNLTGNSGCDSIATLLLTVNNVSAGTEMVTICSNQLPYNWNGSSYAAGGTYSAMLINSTGCDSLVTLVLAVNDNTAGTTPVTICEDQLPYNWNGNNYSAAGNYSITLINSNGCDSVATLILSVNMAQSSTTPVTICNNQLPYSWNNQSYSAAGTYSVTLNSSSGCDSVATLILSTNVVLSSTVALTICQNQLPYNWNGNNYSAPGTYSVVLTSGSGCDSIATLILITNSIVSSLTTVTLCENQLPYNWNNYNYTVAGTYSINLIGNTGCDSVATLLLTINNTTAGTTMINVCENELPFSWNGLLCQSAGTYSLMLTGNTGCDSLSTLILSVSNNTTSTTSIMICQNQLPYLWNGQNYTASGTYLVNLQNSNGCDSIATLILTANSVLTSNTNITICNSDIPYNWNGQSYSTDGTFQVNLISSSGCDSIAILHLTINPVKYSGSNAAICSAELPYQWNNQNYSSSGVYTVTLTSTNGCDSIVTLNLTVNLTPSAPLVNSPVIYCQDDVTTSLEATITTGNQLMWYTSASGGTGLAVAPIPSSSLPGTINYYVSQANGFCEGPRAIITVMINSKPNLGPDKTLKICHGQSTNMASLYGTAGWILNWTLGNQPVDNITNVSVEGVYSVFVQNSLGCRDTALVDLHINPPVIANAGIDTIIETNSSYQLSGSGGLNYQWSPSASLNNPFIANPVTILGHDETFTLFVSDDIGCFDLDTLSLRVLNGPTFYVPTAFTPNGDAVNDVFRPTVVGIKSLQFFRVFNRYGAMVFETDDLKKGWDGTYKGKKQPIDNYVWSLKGTDRFNKVKTLKGNVVLIR